MSNIMLDIETLGTRSTSVILSIGAVEFDKTLQALLDYVKEGVALA